MLQFNCFGLGPLDTNCYMVSNGKEAVVIDPGGNPGQVLRFVANENWKVTHILNTHLHFDHTYGNAVMIAGTGAPVLASERDGFLLEMEHGRGGGFGLPLVNEYAFTNLDEGDLDILGVTCKVLATPGHTPGSLSFYFPPEAVGYEDNKGPGLIFSGDVIFKRSAGRTDFPGGDSDTLMRSIVGKIFTLPPDTIIFSGHGPETTVGEEMEKNPFCGRSKGL